MTFAFSLGPSSFYNVKEYSWIKQGNLFAGGEEDQLKHLTDCLKELSKTGSRSHKDLYNVHVSQRLNRRSYLVLLVLEHDGKGEVGIVQLLEGAVDQGLVEIEDQRELGARPGLQRQRRVPAPHLWGERWQVLDEEVRVELLPVFRLWLRLRRVDLHLRVNVRLIFDDHDVGHLLVGLGLQWRWSRVDNVSGRLQRAGC